MGSAWAGLKPQVVRAELSRTWKFPHDANVAVAFGRLTDKKKKKKSLDQSSTQSGFIRHYFCQEQLLWAGTRGLRGTGQVRSPTCWNLRLREPPAGAPQENYILHS